MFQRVQKKFLIAWWEHLSQALLLHNVLLFSFNVGQHLIVISIYNWVSSLYGQLLQVNTLNHILKQLITCQSRQWP